MTAWEDHADDGVSSVLEAAGADSLECPSNDEGGVVLCDTYTLVNSGFKRGQMRWEGTTHETAEFEDDQGGEDGPFEVEEFIHLSPGALKT